MDRLFPEINSRKRSEISLGFLAVGTIIFSSVIIHGYWGKAAYEALVYIRILHFFIGVGTLLAIYKLRQRWNEAIAKVIFSLLLIPIFFTAWFNHVGMIKSTESWTPFKGFYVVVIVLSVVAPAGYLLNFYFLLAFILEIFLIWYALNIPSYPNIILSGEPYYVLATSFSCLLLLLSRHQDEKKIKQLAAETAQIEFAKNLARVLLTIRDRMNTPLQNLNLLLHILKTNYKLPESKSLALENAIQDLILTNKQFNQLESLIDWQGNNLMSDLEIETWLNTLGQKK